MSDDDVAVRWSVGDRTAVYAQPAGGPVYLFRLPDRGITDRVVADHNAALDASAEVPLAEVADELRDAVATIREVVSQVPSLGGQRSRLRSTADRLARLRLGPEVDEVAEAWNRGYAKAYDECVVAHVIGTAPGQGPVTTDEVAAWDQARFGNRGVIRVALKLAGETGEVCEAVTKRDEGAVRPAKGLVTRDDWTAHLHDEIGDVGIVLHVLAAREGTSLDELVTRRFREDVAQRTDQESPTESAAEVLARIGPSKGPGWSRSERPRRRPCPTRSCVGAPRLLAVGDRCPDCDRTIPENGDA